MFLKVGFLLICYGDIKSWLYYVKDDKDVSTYCLVQAPLEYMELNNIGYFLYM